MSAADANGTELQPAVPLAAFPPAAVYTWRHAIVVFIFYPKFRLIEDNRS